MNANNNPSHLLQPVQIPYIHLKPAYWEGPDHVNVKPPFIRDPNADDDEAQIQQAIKKAEQTLEKVDVLMEKVETAEKKVKDAIAAIAEKRAAEEPAADQGKRAKCDELTWVQVNDYIDEEQWWDHADEDIECVLCIMPNCFHNFLKEKLVGAHVDSALSRLWSTDFAHAAHVLFDRHPDCKPLDWNEGRDNVSRRIFYCYLLSNRPKFWRQASEIVFPHEDGYEDPWLTSIICQNLIKLFFPGYLQWFANIKDHVLTPISAMHDAEDNIPNWGQFADYVYRIRGISRNAEEFQFIKNFSVGGAAKDAFK